MADLEKDTQNVWEERACKTFSAERKEDTVVLVLAAITVALVWTGILGSKFFNSMFF